MLPEPVKAKSEYFRIITEPKGGPEVILIGAVWQEPILSKAVLTLNVQGIVARLAILNEGVRMDCLPEKETKKILTPGVPVLNLCGDPETDANVISQRAMRCMQGE